MAVVDLKKHSKACECPRCLQRKLIAFNARVADLFSPRMPTTLEQCVPVRGHFRRQKNYLKSQPKFREVVMKHLEGLIKEEKVEDKSPQANRVAWKRFMKSK